MNRNRHVQSKQQSTWTLCSGVHSSHTHADELSAQTHTKSSVVCVRYKYFFPPPQLCGEGNERCAHFFPLFKCFPLTAPAGQIFATTGRHSWALPSLTEARNLSVFLLNEHIRGCQGLRNTAEHNSKKEMINNE